MMRPSDLIEQTMDTVHLELLFKNGWTQLASFICNDIADSLRSQYLKAFENDQFERANIGNQLNKKFAPAIRKSHICWISDWKQDEAHKILLKQLESTQDLLKNYFRISLKRFESQVAIYDKGGYYKKHLDQLKKTRHRQFSLIIYLDDCPNGGELVIYSKNNPQIIEQIIKPKKGLMVVFLSKEIFHQVLPVEARRIGVTTWFRDDELIPFI